MTSFDLSILGDDKDCAKLVKLALLVFDKIVQVLRMRKGDV